MKRPLIQLIVLTLLFALSACRTTAMTDSLEVYDLENEQLLSDGQALQRLQHARIVLVGEHHNNADHHLAQLHVIQALHRAGRKVAIGMEMFRRESQQSLNQWTSGRMEEQRFMAVFKDNWNFGWELYRPILVYARDNAIPVVGLNVPRNLTLQVAYYGFQSLTPEQKGSLEGIVCDVTPEYRDFVQRAYGAHSHGRMKFEQFCEAQLVWDSAMALNAIDYLKQNDERIMVIVAGSGHARKLGIPTQLAKRSTLPYLVILPETKGIFEKNFLTDKDADLILLRK
ncbi:MAG: ChaN family lipoprotein [Desulfobacteraceae bacterium]|jgi:uncharacterized iron-regulated protein